MVPLIPRFRAAEEELTGASRGSAYHRVMELLDFTEEYSEESLAAAVRAMEESGRIAPEMARCVRTGDILEFTRCESGRRMLEASRRGQLFREQPFVIGVDMEEVYPDSVAGKRIKSSSRGSSTSGSRRRTALWCWIIRPTRCRRQAS